jgi:hypothetical protein
MFLAAVSGGLVALGLVATASHLDTAFFAFGLVLLPTLAFVGLVTYERTLQSGIEDLGYARRIAQLRSFYFDYAPELAPYLLSVSPEQRLHVQGLTGGYLQRFRTVAGMIAVITAVLSGAALGLGIAAAADSLVASFACGGAFALIVLALMMRYEARSFGRAYRTPIIESDRDHIARRLADE